jgi:asparagine synthase (glutamine-hydrolysing)
MSTLLDRKDRMSMANGLEVRVPFCDHHLVEYVWNIPWEIKYIDKIAKGILRRALRGVLPPKTLTRRKSPYPKTHHPLYLQIMKEQLLRILANPSSSLTQLVDAGKKSPP